MTTTDKLADALRNIVNMLRDHPAMQGREYIDLGIAANNALREYDASLAAPPAQGEWQPIDTAPRDSSAVLVAFRNAFGEWRVREAWWRIPFEGASAEQCWWCYDNTGTLLDASVHGLGASHWMPKPPPPGAAPQPAPAPVQADASRSWPEDAQHENGNYWCECVECGHHFTGHKRRRVCKVCAQPPAPGEAELQTLVKSMRLTATVGVPVKAVCVGRWAERLAAIAALAQPQDAKAIVDHMVNRFLSWKLPQDFAPDCGISFAPLTNPEWTHDVWPIGTNLLHAGQAKALVEHMLAGIVTPTSIDAQRRVPDAVRELPGKLRERAHVHDILEADLCALELRERANMHRDQAAVMREIADQLESALATIDQQQEARGNGE